MCPELDIRANALPQSNMVVNFTVDCENLFTIFTKKRLSTGVYITFLTFIPRDKMIVLTNTDDSQTLVCQNGFLAHITARPIWTSVAQFLREC